MIVLSSKQIYIAIKSNEVYIIHAEYIFQGTPDGMITRFTASITSICYSQSGKYLAAGAR